MFGLKGTPKQLVEKKWQGNLSDFITAIAWSFDGKKLAASTGNGEIIVWQNNKLFTLQTSTGESIDCLEFSFDGKYLAAAGQQGNLKIWRISSPADLENPPHSINYSPAWIDRLAWSPKRNHLAFSTGRQVPILDVENTLKSGQTSLITTLNFQSSTVLDIAWHPKQDYIAICGYQGTKIWNAKDYDDEPYILSIPSATNLIAWSPNGQYLAAANQDNTLTLLEWGNPHPWVMRGFTGKLRSLAWSSKNSPTGAPLLAAASAFSVSVWEKQEDESIGWEAWLLDVHQGFISSINFQPDTFLLASAAEDGLVCIWEKAKQIGQILEGENSFTCLKWDKQGNQLAAGGNEGQLTIWSKSLRGKGFG